MRGGSAASGVPRHARRKQPRRIDISFGRRRLGSPPQRRAQSPNRSRRAAEAGRPDAGHLLEVLERPPTNVWTCDTQVRVTSILYANLLEKEPESYIGGTDYDWLTPSEADVVMSIKRRALEQLVPVRERVVVRWEGQVREFDQLAIPNLDAQGKAYGLTCIAVDITPRMDWLTGLSLSERLQRADGAQARPTIGQGIRSLLGQIRGARPPVPGAADVIGEVFVDSSIHGVRGPVSEVRLSRTEWLLLQELLGRRGSVVTREQLLEKLWGLGYEHEPSLLHDAMSRLRHRFQAAGLRGDPIETVYGVGYRLRG